jgi:hypothetical protein
LSHLVASSVVSSTHFLFIIHKETDIVLYMTKFFAVVTGRDHIKINNISTPFWGLLDRQPFGWLTSIANLKKDIPKSKKKIVDCGAWTYRKKAVPELRGIEVDARSVFDFYNGVANKNDFIVAPDHMYIDGSDIEYRRKFNREQAKRFLFESSFRGFSSPMAVVHGVDMDEKIEYAISLMEMGYRNLCLGGLAAYPRNKLKNISSVQKIVNTITPYGEFWVHVLGLSSPDYVQAWREIGVSSFDGSSYFKKALMHGVYLIPSTDGGFVEKKTKDGIGYICECRACVTVRLTGNENDTRLFGNAIRNIGRAAHNLNILMSTYEEII